MKLMAKLFIILPFIALPQVHSLYAMEKPVEWKNRSLESRMQDVVRTLKENGFAAAEQLLENPNALDGEGNNALLWVSQRYHWNIYTQRILGTLLEAGGNINFANPNNGNTPLLAALTGSQDRAVGGHFWPSEEMAEWLIKNGADVNARTRTGKTVDTLIGNLKNEFWRADLNALVAQKGSAQQKVPHLSEQSLPEAFEELLWLFDFLSRETNLKTINEARIELELAQNQANNTPVALIHLVGSLVKLNEKQIQGDIFASTKQLLKDLIERYQKKVLEEAGPVTNIRNRPTI